MSVFLNIRVLQGGVVSPLIKPQAGGPPLVGCPRLLIQFIRSYPPYQKPFLHPQPEGAPCRGGGPTTWPGRTDTCNISATYITTGTDTDFVGACTPTLMVERYSKRYLAA